MVNALQVIPSTNSGPMMGTKLESVVCKADPTTLVLDAAAWSSSGVALNACGIGKIFGPAGGVKGTVLGTRFGKGIMIS